MFRSKYAAEDVPTFVELEFMYRRQRYTIRRNPDYMRPKGRGTGYTLQKADAVLVYPDGRQPVTKTRDVTKAVEELIGLNYSQFTQIAMIAQGDFQKLLLAGTADRSVIFRQIFHTGLYQQVQILSLIHIFYEDQRNGAQPPSGDGYRLVVRIIFRAVSRSDPAGLSSRPV